MRSCARHETYYFRNTINVKLKTSKPSSTAGRACHAEAVSDIKENYAALLIAIAEICECKYNSQRVRHFKQINNIRI